MSKSLEADTSKRLVEHQPSETAMANATMRALAAHDEREEVRGSDYLAELFLNEDRKSPLKDPAVREWVMKNKIAPGAYEFMIARTAFFDHVVEQTLRENVRSNRIPGSRIRYPTLPFYRSYPRYQDLRVRYSTYTATQEGTAISS